MDQEWLTLVMSDVRETLKGTALESARMAAVSSVTGDGIKELIELIETELQSTPRRPDTGRPRLPIDRVFSVAGFGTVVTGTLIDGRLTVGQELEVLPKGLKVRVRGLQAHKKKVDEMSPGTRTAVNLTGVDADQLARGDVLTTPGWLRPTEAADVKLRILPSAPMAVGHNASVILYIGTSEVPARVRLLDADELKPGETSWAQVHMEKPIVAVKGDYFIIRNSAGTLGGGEIVDPHARRHRRRQQSLLDRLTVMEQGSPEEIVLKAMEAAEGSEARGLASRANMAWADIQGVLQTLAESKRAVALAERVNPNTLVYSAQGWKSLQEKARQVLEQYHRQYPLRRGASKEELRSRLNVTASAFVSILRRLQAEGALVEEGATVRLPAHQ
ncbi:MAG: DNA/RNA-binding winged helix domain-containing protein, partial [Chloroflexota bacterium]